MPVAGIVAAGVSAVGGAISAKKAKKAAQSAANAQIQSAQMGIDEQRRQFDLSRADQAPWLQAGQQALGQQGGLLGLNGADAQQAGIDALRASPGYQSLYRNGEESVLSNASATGGLRGGNTQHSLYNLGEDTLSAVIQNQLANLGGISGLGQNSAQNIGALGANKANQVSSLFDAQGTAKARGILGGAAASQTFANDLFGSVGGLFGGAGNSGFGQGGISNSIANLFKKRPTYGTPPYSGTSGGWQI